MLRYKTETRPGLVALYDIWPGNGAGQILQPLSPDVLRSKSPSHRLVPSSNVRTHTQTHVWPTGLD